MEERAYIVCPLYDLQKRIEAVHFHVNHSADWHGGCTYCLEGISPIAKGDSKWRDAFLFTAML